MMRFLTLVLAGLLFTASDLRAEQSWPEMTVWKSPSCGCCGDWIDHMRASGFDVKVVDTEDVDHFKDMYKVPEPLRSCHTARVGNYVVEGHVPADDVKDLLTKGLDVSGVAVPGMPMGSPGMEMGGQKDAYRVIMYDQKQQYFLLNEYK